MLARAPNFGSLPAPLPSAALQALSLYAALLQQQAFELACQVLSPATDAGAPAAGAAGPAAELGSSLSGLSLRSPDSFGRSLSSSSSSAPVGAAPARTLLPSSSAGAGSSGSSSAARASARGASPSPGVPRADSSLGGGHAGVVSLYRQAAGVYQHIAEHLFPAAVEAGGFPPGTPFSGPCEELRWAVCVPDILACLLLTSTTHRRLMQVWADEKFLCGSCRRRQACGAVGGRGSGNAGS